MEYQSPVPMGDGSWQMNYENMGESSDGGRIEMDDYHYPCTLLIKWENGVDWACSGLIKQSSEKVNDMMLGDVTKTTYSGLWTDNTAFEFSILKTINFQCTFELREGRVIDKEKGIKGWRKIYRFSNEGKCLMY